MFSLEAVLDIDWQRKQFALLVILMSLMTITAEASNLPISQKIQSFIDAEQLDSADVLVEQLIIESKQKRDYANLARGHLFSAEIEYYYRDQTERALTDLRLLFQLYGRIRSSVGMGRVFFKGGEIALNMNELVLAEQFYEKAIALARTERQNRLLSEIYDQKAIIKSQNGDITAERQLRIEALEIALEHRDYAIAYDLYGKLATSYKQAGELDSAAYYFEDLVALKRQQGDDRKMIYDLRELASIHKQQGTHAEAQAYLFEALNAVESDMDSIATIEVLTEIGKLFNDQQRWKEALENLKRARSLLNTWGGEYAFIELEILNEARRSIQQIGGQKNGVAYLKETLSQSKDLGHRLMAAELFFQLGQAERIPAYYDSSLVYFEEVLVRKKQNQESLGVVEVNLAIAQVYLVQNKGKRAINILKDGIQVAEKSNSMDLLADLYRLLVAGYEQTADFELALRSHQKYSLLKDTLLSIEKATAIEKINQEYKRNKELLALTEANHQAENAMKDLRLKSGRRLIMFLIISLFSLGVITLLAFYSYRSNKQQQLQSQQLEMMEKEKESQHLRSMILGEENERKRIAQELHDGLGTLLATVKLHFNAVQNDVPKIPKITNYKKAYDLLENACSEVRKISYNMMPGILQQYGLEYAVKDMCNSINDTQGIQVSFIPFGLDQLLERYVEVSVYRITQELLKNILKHADASEVIVQMTLENNNFNLLVEDNGRGFDIEHATQKSGLGLKSIRSRVALLKGEFQIESIPGEGSTFNIDFPLKSMEPAH